MNTRKNLFPIILVIVIVLVVGGIVYFAVKPKSAQAGQYDELAKCITAKGAKFYGAFWCSHCENQKKAFGTSQQYLPYVECSTADGQSQLQICKDKNIDGYPTWEFADGSRVPGEMSLKDLAAKTGCSLPSTNANTNPTANTATVTNGNTNSVTNTNVTQNVNAQ